MKNVFLSTLLSTCITLFAAGQSHSWNVKNNLTVVSYNIENLFDTIDNPNTFDEEFTPGSEKQWNTQRYYKKLNDLAKVIKNVNKYELPEIVGLVEAENKQVLEDLAKTEDLKAANYQIILEESPDFRGIDCGLMYNPKEFKYLSHKTFPVKFTFAPNRSTRDVLYVKGKIKKETVHIFVNHWSSRRGGTEKSEPKRIACATVLKTAVDSILNTDAKAKIIMMGDLNDNPDNNSIYQTLGAGPKDSDKNFVNLLYNYEAKDEGTYYYRGNYGVIDHIIVTRNFMNQKSGLRLLDCEGFIHNPEFLCYKNKNGDLSPSKTYGGKNYYGGFSDHFAIYATFIVK